jgi:hypothetical protein
MIIHFAAPGLFATEAATEAVSVTVRALLFYEGKHTDSMGKSKTFSAATVQAIAAATNLYLKSGRRAKFFADHEYSQRNVLGAIEGEVTAQEITEVPHKGMEGLIGKIGIYANVVIAGEENVIAYNDGRIKEISVGIDTDGKTFGVKNAIYELSAVGIPALAGAALFAKTLSESMSEMTAAQAQDRLMSALDEVWWAFRRTIADIGESGDPSGSAMMLKAAQDFSDVLLAQFALNNPPPEELPPEQPLIAPPSVPLFNQAMPLTEEQIAELQAKADRADALEKENTSLKRSQEVASRFGKLKETAVKLRQEGKLTPAKFKAMGFEDESSVSKFAAGDDRELDKLEIQLDTIAECATPVKFGSYLGGEGLPGQEGAKEDKELDSEVESFFAARPIASMKTW